MRTSRILIPAYSRRERACDGVAACEESGNDSTLSFVLQRFVLCLSLTACTRKRARVP